MVERKKIGLIYNYSEEWIAGAYYILNIIKSLNYLPENRKPIITILYYYNNGLDLVKETHYPYLSYYDLTVNPNIFKRAVNKITRKLKFGNIFLPNYCKLVNYVYPYGLEGISNEYYWIPDFQEDYYPQYFSDEEIAKRKKKQKLISDTTHTVVFSSNNALNDFKRLYPNFSCKVKVLQFASVITKDYKNIDPTILLNKYLINKPYFFVPNQFWQHKNHITILEAIDQLKQFNLNFEVVFSGKESDNRNANHITTLKNFITEMQINEYVRFLGFIDRDEQLKLMDYSIAIIQPSLFEGWSTVVEDAKALNKHIVLSDIPVHLEQINVNATFFESVNASDLAKKIIELLNTTDSNVTMLNYDANIQKFALDFLDIFE